MANTIKAFFAWVYEWVTVITSVVVGVISVIPDALSSMTGIDLSPLIGTQRAAQTVVLVAILKAVTVAYRNKQAVK